MSLKLFTTHNYDENAYTPLGFVRGTMVHAVSVLRDVVGNITGIFGGVNKAINKKIDDTYDEAIEELIKYTTSKYQSATAIAGINVSLTEMREFIICVACGTALSPRSSSSSSSSSSELVKPNAPLTSNPINAPVPKGGFTRYKHQKTKTKTKTKKHTKRHR
jgi:uncharacterized protein YbjQ (UPF0145 family)